MRLFNTEESIQAHSRYFGTRAMISHSSFPMASNADNSVNTEVKDPHVLWRNPLLQSGLCTFEYLFD